MSAAPIIASALRVFEDHGAMARDVETLRDATRFACGELAGQQCLWLILDSGPGAK
jgi:hypothetical protein